MAEVFDKHDKVRAWVKNDRLGLMHPRGPWRSFNAVKYATLEWVDWFNNRRLLEPIGNIPPAARTCPWTRTRRFPAPSSLLAS